MNNTPVFCFMAEGNQKDKLSNWKYTYAVSFEEHLNKTFCAIKAAVLNRSERRNTEQNILIALRKINLKPLGLRYYPGGCDIIQYWQDNNLLN